METTTYITTGEAKREIGEWDRSREGEGESLKTCSSERREECSQRCSQGCWVGRRQWAKLRGWLLERSSAWLDDSKGIDREFNPHCGFSATPTDNWSVLEMTTHISSLHLDSQWEEHTETEMLRSVRHVGQCCLYIASTSATPLFSSACLFSPLLFSFPSQPQWILIQLWADWTVSAKGPLGPALKISTFTGERSMASASAIGFESGHSKPQTCYHCMNCNGGTAERGTSPQWQAQGLTGNPPLKGWLAAREEVIEGQL